ncbi:helix-turn-helix domain-containing protein [Halorientalis sp.]|jgi:DNA-binding IclR family transcriptional regulator|uniref:helix-turn-helix domain-containing protein n=1 Tax=Halorientalis sp. TaxID=1931229 RepID=UPI00262D2D75|nr:helix-turn-helix domain-containing protein [Halorientalis sp.]
MRSADERILRQLQEAQPGYLALIANRLGMHLAYVERRCAVLVEHGLVEPVSGEVVYQTTDRGEQFLSEEAERETDATDAATSD